MEKQIATTEQRRRRSIHAVPNHRSQKKDTNVCIQFDEGRRGNKMLNYSREKIEGTYRSGEGEEGPLCDPGSELLLGGRARVVLE